MRSLLIGTAVCALTASTAGAQTATTPSAPEGSASYAQDERFQVLFPLDSAELDAVAQQEVARAADNWEPAESREVSVIGHSDTSGSAEYNMQLSEQRAQAVEGALLSDGVSADRISATARGENDLLVPTADGVREEQNRRAEIIVPVAAEVEETAQVAPQPAPVPAATTPTAPELQPEPEPNRFTFALGPVYGHNFGETDDGDEDDLVGAELRFQALPGFLGGVSLSQMGLWSFNSNDDGLAGRTVGSLDFAPDFGGFRPTLAVNGGLVYGDGVQDGFVVGPELRLDAVPIVGWNIGIKVAYDYQFETGDWDEGILWTGLDLGIRF
jgi:hypothetical protein